MLKRLLLSIFFFVYFTSPCLAFFSNSNADPLIPGEGLEAEGNKDWQKAISIYLADLSKNPDQVALWLRIATIEHQLKNYTLSIDAYQHAITLQPNNPALHKIFSEVYAELNQPTEALSEISIAVKLKPKDLIYLTAKAKIANWNQQLEIALATQQEILNLSKTTNTASNPVDVYTKIGVLQNQLHHYPEAISAYNQAIQLNPNSAILYNQLSQIYSTQKDPKNALLTLNKALSLEPNNLNFLNAKAHVATWLSDYTLATETYQEMLRISPGNPTAQKGMALALHLINISKTNPILKTLSPLEQLLNEANNEALSHHYFLAAKSMRQAILLQPKDPVLYKKLAEIYATAKQPQLALSAINKAIKLAPSSITYLRSKATLAAWANDKPETLDTYQRILTLKPYDADAMLNVAHTLAWMGHTDASIHAYRQLLHHYPKMAEGWIQYADILSWPGNFIAAFDAIAHYRQLKGETTAYLKTKARVLALDGRFKSARAINEPLLLSKPNDPYLLATEVTALTNALQIKNALTYLQKLNKINPNDPLVRGLNDITLTPIRTRFNLEADSTGASDTTRIQDYPVSVQYFLTPATSLLFQGLYERATASPSSSLRPINSTGSIADESVRVGFTTQIQSLNLKALAGGLKIQQGGNHAIYDALLNTNLDEKSQLTLETSRDLFRPYLVPQTPKLISLQIMESRFGGFLQWQPFVEKYLNVVLSYSDLTNNNNYLHANVWPKARILASEHWLVTLGVDTDIWQFRRRATDGYYSPLHFYGYEGTLELYYSQSENMGYGFSGGWGMQKDEAFPHYFYEEDLAAQVFWGIFTDWELQLKAGYTLRENPTGNYHCWTSGIVLTRRF